MNLNRYIARLIHDVLSAAGSTGALAETAVETELSLLGAAGGGSPAASAPVADFPAAPPGPAREDMSSLRSGPANTRVARATPTSLPTEPPPLPHPGAAAENQGPR